MSEREEKTFPSQSMYLVKGTFPHRSQAQKRIYGKVLDSVSAQPVYNIVHFYSATGFFIKLVDNIDSIELDYVPVTAPPVSLRPLPPPPSFIAEDFEGFAIGGLDDISYAGYLYNPVFFAYQDFESVTTETFTSEVSRDDIATQGDSSYIL